MNISANGIAFIKAEEAFIPVPRTDTSLLCWGYGHDELPSEHIPQSISESDADALLLHDLCPHEVRVSHLAGWTNQINSMRCVHFPITLEMAR